MNRFRGWLLSPRLAFWMEKLEPVLSVVMILGGLLTMLYPPYGGFNEIGLFYLSSAGLFALGFVFTLSGILLLFARIVQHIRLRQYALMVIYTSTFFTFWLQVIVHRDWYRWGLSLLIAVVAALEYLRFTYLTRG